MLIERNKEGAYVVSELVGNHLVTRRYYGYTRREAAREFRRDLKEEVR